MCMRQCSDEEEARHRRIMWTRMQLAVPPGGPLCELDMLPGNYMVSDRSDKLNSNSCPVSLCIFY